MDNEQPPPHSDESDADHAAESQRQWRMEKAERFLYQDLGEQRCWYDRKARSYKQYHIYTSLAILAAGAATMVLQLWGTTPDPIAVATAMLGAVVVLLKGMQELYLYQETWLSYRKAAESMKREYRLFVNKSGPYRRIDDDELAYCRFVERIEAIIAEEQKLFFERQQESSNQ